MQELDDSTLLREYVERDSEAAFAALVTRHVNKVYSVALRHTRNAHQAEEISQAVFVILAKKSRRLGKRVILSGWLYHTARLTAVTFIRSEVRRARREQEAYMQNSSNETESEVWSRIAPLLDAAMAGLSEVDRHAVVLRYFDGRSMKEVGAALGRSEDAAKVRVNRAVEKLRYFFTKRGIVLSAGGLTAAMSAHSVQAAPAVLTKSITAVAMTKGVAASGSTLTLIKGALKVMAWTKAKIAITGTVILACAATTTFVVHHEVKQHEIGKQKASTYSGPNFLSKDSLANAGYQTPETSLITMLWAMSEGDVNAMLAGATPTLKSNMERELQRAPQSEFVAKMKQKFSMAGDYQVVGKTIVSDSQVRITVAHTNAGVNETYTMTKIGNDWKFGK